MKQNLAQAIENVRLFNEQKEEAIDGSLEESLDVLKVYTSAIWQMQKGSTDEQELAKRMLETAKTYNEVVRKSNSPPKSLSDILKQFFKKFAGFPEAQIRDEIYLPVHIQFSTEEDLKHKITFSKEETSGKILSALQAVQRASDSQEVKQYEVDLFRVKALTLLLNQSDFPITINEALTLIHETEITCTRIEGAYLLHDNEVLLEQTITVFPGVKVTIKGAFSRDTFHPELISPIRGSFQRTSSIYHTGFPHPSQYLGIIAFSEKMLPSSMLRPQMCPKFQRLIAEKQLVAEELAAFGPTYEKAKRLLHAKKALLEGELARDVMELHRAIGMAAGVPDATFNHLAIESAIERLQEEWLIKHNPKIAENPYEECAKIIHEKSPITKACTSIYLMQLSEHLNFEPKDLNHFERMLITSLLRQQLIFIHELRELDETTLYNHLKKVLQGEIALFCGKSTHDIYTQKAEELTEEIFQYYCIRFEALER